MDRPSRDDTLDRLRARPWRRVSVPEQVLAVPSMLSVEERALLYWLGSHHVSPGAWAVDAGAFLGGSTVALASGLASSSPPGARVASYDLFRAEKYSVGDGWFTEAPLAVGDSFRDRFDAHLGDLASWVDVREGDLMDQTWSGAPIDVLFLDALKDWPVADHALLEFFPALVPGRSVVVQQDYGWGQLPWIHITMEWLGDSFELLDSMPHGSHVFLLRAPIPRSKLIRTETELDSTAHWALMSRAIARAEGEIRTFLELARVSLISMREGSTAAWREIDRIERETTPTPAVQLCIDRLRQLHEGAARPPSPVADS